MRFLVPAHERFGIAARLGTLDASRVWLVLLRSERARCGAAAMRREATGFGLTPVSQAALDAELAATAYAAPCCKLPSLWGAPGYGVPGCWPLRLRTGRVCWWVWPVAAAVVVVVVVRLRVIVC